jgi:hypothetical protein
MRFLLCCALTLGTLTALAEAVEPVKGSQPPTFRTIYTFTDGQDTAHPLCCPLALDPEGNLYGVTDGVYLYQALTYELAPPNSGLTGWTFTPLVTIGTSLYPSSCLARDTEGNLYGESYGEFECCGSIYELSPDGSGRWSTRGHLETCISGSQPG